MQKSKRGLSPAIATVLLVSITLVLASMVFFQMKNFLRDQMDDSEIDLARACKGVAFDLDYSVISGAGTAGSQSVSLRVANRGNVPISDLNIKFVRGGNSNFTNYSGFFNADVGMTSEKKIIPVVGANQIVVYPIVQADVSNNGFFKNVSCTDGKVINL